MTILVTGATGTVGKHVTELLVKRNIPVRALTRNAERARARLPGGVQIAEGDLMNPETLRDAYRIHGQHPGRLAGIHSHGRSRAGIPWGCAERTRT